MKLPGRKSRGLWIAFFGPDGVGKSAVIEQLRPQIGPEFSGVAQFHFRPMFGRAQNNRPPVTDPHGRSPRSRFISRLKLAYWLLDCWLGYLTLIRSALRRSRLVLFDRYFPDALVDPARYRLPASCLRFARCLAALAPRPDLYVLLDAPADVVQARKAEVSASESQRQRAAYLAMFQRIPNKVIVAADRPVHEVAQRLGGAVLSLLTDTRSQHRKAFLLEHL